MNYYVYYSYETFGRGYIGSRKCNCDPTEDVKYFGSYTDKNFKPTEKIILEVFENYSDALDAEIKLHNFFEVSTNPHFANKVKQTSTGFTSEGTKRSEETKQKHRETAKKNKHKYLGGLTAKGRKNTPETIEKMRLAHLGVRHSETRRKRMSESHKGKVISDEQKLKISKSLIGRPKLPCPICEKLITDYKMSFHINKIHKGDSCG